MGIGEEDIWEREGREEGKKRRREEGRNNVICIIV